MKTQVTIQNLSGGKLAEMALSIEETDTKAASPEEAAAALKEVKIPAGLAEGDVRFLIGSAGPFDLKQLRGIAATKAQPAPALWKPRAPRKASRAGNVGELMVQFRDRLPGHIETALVFSFQNMFPQVRDRIRQAYPAGEGIDEAKFSRDFEKVVLGKLKGFDWPKILALDSDQQAAKFKLENVSALLKDVGKDIVIGAVFVQAPEGKLIRAMSEADLFTQYETTWGTGIKKSGECGGKVFIRFGGGLAGGNRVTVVNDNSNHLVSQGVQYWRLNTYQSQQGDVPKECKDQGIDVKDITVNTGIQSIFPYEGKSEKGEDLTGFVVTYVLMAVPSIQMAAERAMKDTMNSIETLAEKP